MFITVVSRIVNNIIIIKYLLVQLSILFERTPYKAILAELLSVPTFIDQICSKQYFQCLLKKALQSSLFFEILFIKNVEVV